MAWISGLSKAGQRVFHFLIKGIQEGLSGTEIMHILRQHGLGYRLSDFYNDLRVLKGETLRWDTMKYVPRDKSISERLYTPTTTTGPTRFVTVFEAKIQDTITGEVYTTYLSVNHDYPMRRSELEEQAESTLHQNPEGYDLPFSIRVLKLTPVRGFRRL
ncbi:MAG: hypothetical protein QXZ58_08320 [Candidatus Nezhaarchaeales archaeon]